MKYLPFLLVLPAAINARPFRGGLFKKDRAEDSQQNVVVEPNVVDTNDDRLDCLLLVTRTKTVTHREDGTERTSGYKGFSCEFVNAEGRPEILDLVGFEERVKKMKQKARALGKSSGSVSSDDDFIESGALRLVVNKAGAKLEKGTLTLSNGDDDDDDDGLDLVDRFTGLSTLREWGSDRPRLGPDVFASPFHIRGGGENDGDDRRGLQAVGPRSTLVIRATIGGIGESQLADAIFGQGWTLRTAIHTCSFGQLDLIPATWGGQNGNLIRNGVLSVNIGSSLPSTDRRQVFEKLWFGAEALLGLGANGNWIEKNFNHLIFSIPGGTEGGWVAEGWINHWGSLYNDNWVLSPTALMHEIGHNLNLDHSGEGTNEYDDGTGVMGASSGSQGGPQMCYNSAKSYQLGWYNKQVVNWDPATQGPLATRMVGVVDYDPNAAYSTNDCVVLKIGPYYIGYNKVDKFNLGTWEGGNQVNIVQQDGDAQKSWVRARLNPGQSYTIWNYAGGNLIIEWVGWDQNRPYLDVYYEGQPRAASIVGVTPQGGPKPPTQAIVPSPTTAPAPTKKPTAAPTKKPVAPPTPAPKPVAAPTKKKKKKLLRV